VPIPGLHRTLFTVLACKTGGFQESKVNYFNDLQKLRGQLIRLSIRAGTGIEPFKTKAYTGGREIGFGGLVPIRSRWPRNFALSEVDDADPSRNSDPDLHQQFDNALVDTPRGRHRYPWESAPDT
jgi:hypothetical protein